jgi:hypothetical protein
MTYAKPQVVCVGRAVAVIENPQVKGTFAADGSMTYVSPAYDLDD